MSEIKDGIHYYQRESDAAEAVAVRPPVGYDGIKKHGVVLIIHGVGEFSDGTLQNLENVMTGFDYDGDGPRQREDAVLYPAFRSEADKRGYIIVVVTYKNAFNPNDVDYALNLVERDFSVDRTREAIIGFSWGGRELMRYLTSSALAPRRLALAVLCAPVNPGGNLQYIVDARLQVIGISYQEDPRVDPSNLKAIIAGINKLAPEIKPYLIELPGRAHGGLSEIQASTHTLIPQHVLAYLDSVSTENRKQYPTTGIAKPVDPAPTDPTLTAVFNITKDQVVTTSSFELDASASTGVKDGADGYIWDVRPITGLYGFVVNGGAWGGPKKLLTGLVNGTYEVKLTTKSKTGATTQAVAILTVNLIPTATKTVKSFAFGSVTFTDESSEPAVVTSVTHEKRVTIKTNQGVTYEF